jgi:hypothetical protein
MTVVQVLVKLWSWKGCTSAGILNMLWGGTRAGKSPWWLCSKQMLALLQA